MALGTIYLQAPELSELSSLIAEKGSTILQECHSAQGQQVQFLGLLQARRGGERRESQREASLVRPPLRGVTF